MKFIFYTILALIAIAVLAFLWAVFSGIYKWVTGKITKEDRKRMLEQYMREKAARKAKKAKKIIHGSITFHDSEGLPPYLMDDK